MLKNVTFDSVKRKLNNIMLAICGVILAVCFFTSVGSHSNESYTQVIEPYTVATLSDGCKEYYFDLLDYDYNYSGIMFYTSHQFVQVYNAGRLIYSFDTPGGFWGSTPGSTYNFIEVNEKMLHVAVKVTPAYQIVEDQDITFYIGSSYQMYNDLLGDSMPHYVSSLLIILFSGLIFGYYFFMHKKQNLDKELIHLAYFAFFLGLWTYKETTVAVLVSNNQVFDAIVPYFCLMLVVPPFVLFFDAYLELHNNVIKHIIVIASMVQFAVLTTLHFTKIAEFRETLICTQIMLLVAGIYAVAGVLVQISRKNLTRHVVVCSVGLTLFVIATLVDIVKYYTKIGDSDYAGRYIFLVFIVLLAWDLIRGTYEIIEKGRRAKQLEVFALTDSMTGLFNRNAFETQVQAEKSLEGMTVVVADANGLKKCNDTFGHEAGDEYITIVADMFNKVYGKYGECYRTGGDEFCCIIPANKCVDMERLKNLFVAKIYTANLEGGHAFDIGVAIGHASYDKDMDEDFRALIKRADACMYENKKKTKKIS
ncbi:MAG: GGDEF domain-containing protein [Pseudobutyrivibrio sp.]|nr:GGDEF domain-containing protein [Pseudobutyrivibrio sp.]